ncbi:hypothetical protein [Phenylobacterium sp.]|uniref:hypothetical protein n=1 Tax=Phenylobacterium sp. TaxID=1871053 RepID=UPI0030F3E1A4
MNAAFDTVSLTPLSGGRASDITFLVARSASVWTVTKDDRFYGDYLKEEDARASAQCAVADILAKGGEAKAWLLPASLTGEARLPIALDTGACRSPSRYPVPEAATDTFHD